MDDKIDDAFDQVMLMVDDYLIQDVIVFVVVEWERSTKSLVGLVDVNKTENGEQRFS